MLFLNLDGRGFVVTKLFWGLWLLPLALLVYRSRSLARFLACGSPRRIRLGPPEPYRHTMAAISGPGRQQFSARLLRGDCVHVVAAYQGSQAADGTHRDSKLFCNRDGPTGERQRVRCARVRKKIGRQRSAINFDEL